MRDMVDCLANDDSNHVTVFAREWLGEIPAAVRFEKLNPLYFGSTLRDWTFERAVRRIPRADFDLIVSDQKIAGIDVYIAGGGVHIEWAERKLRAMPWGRRMLGRLQPHHLFTMNAEQRLFRAETLRAVRQRYPGRRVWCVLEPRSWSLRRNVFQDRLAGAFDDADEIVLAEVFGADQLPEAERLDPEQLVAGIARRGRPARFLPGVDAIVAYLAAETRREDVVAILSNGGFGGIHAKLLAALGAKR